MAEPAPFERAVAHARAGRYGEARAALDTHLARRPQDAAAWAMRGSLEMELGQIESALASYDRSLALRPGHPATEVNRANALARLGRSEAAVEGYDRAIAAEPGLAQAHGNRAKALLALMRFEDALASAERAIALSPQYAHAWNHKGVALEGLDRHSEALAALAHANGLDGGNPEILTTLGTQLSAMGRPQEALAAFDRAVAAAPDSALTRFGRSQPRLLLGDYRGGWEDYEYRWRTETFKAKAVPHTGDALRARLTLWPRREDLAGRRVAVISEQGVGDEIMFASMIPDLAAIAASVSLFCEPRLADLFAASFPDVEVIGVDERSHAAGRWDVIVAIGSLAAALRNDEADFPGQAYLRPRPAVAEAWRARLGPPTGRRRVGVSWKGGSANARGRARSMALEGLRPLLERDDCDFVSLQYGDVAAEVAAFNATLPRPIACFAKAEIDDFEQLAGLLCELDLVISVQTAVIHLSGALGRPCWVMVPQWPEWRYRIAGETMPWYGSVRLFRQDGSGDWAPVVARVNAALGGPGGNQG